jgi:hypothetical protein
MPSEIFTKTGQDVALYVKRQFGDTDGRQATDADILGWINVVQQEIVSQNPILKEVLESVTVIGQDVYAFPASLVQYIESIHLDGKPLASYTFQEAERYIMEYTGDADKESSVPDLWYERDGAIYVYPVPNKVQTFRMFYQRRPSDLTALGDDLQVPDRYFQRVVDGVLARAYQLDGDWEAAQYKQQEFFNGMNLLANQENVPRATLYPSPTVREEDL